MSRVFTLLAVLVLVVACDNTGSEQGGDSAQDTGSPEGIPLETSRGEPMIPDEEYSEFEKLANAYIRPYFDEEGTVTELAVAPGDQFNIWLFAEFNTTHPMSAMEFMLIVPDGVTIFATQNTKKVRLTMGAWDTDVSIAFHCMNGPKHWIVKYLCQAEENFAGGTVRTAKGQVQGYLGFTMCDASKTMIRAKPAQVTLRKK